MRPITIGISLKAYFGHRRAAEWFADLAARVAGRPELIAGGVTLFVAPSYPQLPAALAAFSGGSVRVGAQDVSQYGPGPFTGEVTAAELVELGVTFVEIGHAERRRLFGETDGIIAAKMTAALREGLTPVLCLGEMHSHDADRAAAVVVEQLSAGLAGAPAGPIVVAYEPVWAIGASEPAPTDHVRSVIRVIRDVVHALPTRAGSAVIYGGSAGPGLLTELGDAVDGIFLGRFAHDPSALISVLDEAAALATRP